jgi:hypothetical protein
MDRRARVRGGLLGFLPAAVLLWAGAVGMRWAGTAGRLGQVERAVDAQDLQPLSDAGVPERIAASLGTGLLGDLLNRLDPLNSREAGIAAALLVLQRNPVVWERTVRHPLAGPVILLPAFHRLRGDNDVQHALSFSHYSRLLALSEMDAALDDRVLREAVLNLDTDSLLPELITGRPPAAAPRAMPVPEP